MNLVDKVISEISNKLDVDKTLVREELSQGGKFGHVSLKTFNLSEKIKKSPEKLTEIIEDSLKNIMPLTQVSNIGPYINLNFNGNVIAEEVIANIRKKGEDFGSSDINKDKLYLVEYSSPNIGKPLHVGHIRSTVLGDSISNILRFTGAKTYDINYLGDTGLHIGKIIAAFNLWGSKKDFDLDPENTMLNLYVRFSKEEAENPKLSILANEILEKIEAKDIETLKKLDFISDESNLVFQKIYSLLGINFDEITGQSKFSERGKKVVENLISKDIAKIAENGGIYVPLNEFNLPDKAVLRKNGTAIYATQDLGTAVDRFERFGFDKMLYIVGNEQETYFKQIFSILNKGGYNFVNNCEHISFGMLNLPDGKMKTREGNVINLEEVIMQSINLAKENLSKRNPELKGDELETLSQQIGVGALKYMILSIEYKSDIAFSWEKALNFSGKSGPYIQYGAVRAKKLLQGNELNLSYNANFSSFDSDLESKLLFDLSLFESVIENSAIKRRPDLLCSYIYNLTKSFSQVYTNIPILSGNSNQDEKLELVNAYSVAMQNGLHLLGINIPEKM